MDAAALAQVAARRSRSYWLLSRLVAEVPDAPFLGELSATLAGAQVNVESALGVETAALIESVAGIGSSTEAITALRVERMRLLDLQRSAAT